MVGLVAALALLQHPEWGPEPPVAPMDHNPMPQERVIRPIIFPLVGPCRWSDDFGVNRGAFRHSGIDIKAPKMTPIVAPFRGKLGMKRDSFWIYADDGWAMLGTHLNDEDLNSRAKSDDWDVMFAPNIEPNMTVEEGQLIGYVGQSGDATAYHLHFELYAPGTGRTEARVRNPFPSLKMAQFLRAPRPVMAEPEDRPAIGQMKLEACIRKVDPTNHILIVILVSRETPGAKKEAVTYPSYRRIFVPDAVINQIGGWAALDQIPNRQPISITISAVNTNEPLSALRIKSSYPAFIHDSKGRRSLGLTPRGQG